MKNLILLAITIIFLTTACAGPAISGEKEDLAFNMYLLTESIKARTDEVRELQRKYKIDEKISEINNLQKQLIADQKRLDELIKKEKPKEDKVKK